MPKRKLPKPKTKKEVEAEIKRAEEFAKEHPTSIFGDNNVRKVAIFKRICKAYLNGVSLDKLEDENNEEADDLESEKDEELREESEEENREIDDIINWLRSETDEHFW